MCICVRTRYVSILLVSFEDVNALRQEVEQERSVQRQLRQRREEIEKDDAAVMIQSAARVALAKRESVRVREEAVQRQVQRVRLTLTVLVFSTWLLPLPCTHTMSLPSTYAISLFKSPL